MKIKIEKDIEEKIYSEFYDKKTNITNLSKKYKYGIKPIQRILKEKFGIETYSEICQFFIEEARMKGARKTKKEGKKIAPRTEEWCKAISESNKGRKLSKEHKKMALKNITNLSEDQMQKRIQNGIKTKQKNGYFEIWSKKMEPYRKQSYKFTEEQKKKLSKIRKEGIASGRIPTMKGFRHSKETREKLRKITKERWKNGAFDCYVQSSGLFRSSMEIEIYNILKEKHKEISHSYRIPKESKVYDIYIKSKNLLIEFNGDFWHLNPKFYDDNYFCESRKIYAKDIRKKDNEKIAIAKKHGYNIITIWENDIKNKNKKQIKEFIYGATNNFN